MAIRSETALIKPFMEAEAVLSGFPGNVSGDGVNGSYVRMARTIRYSRLVGPPEGSRNGKQVNELAGAYIGIGMALKAYPDFFKEPPRGLVPYSPMAKTRATFECALVDEAGLLMEDALKPFLIPGNEQVWAVGLMASIAMARQNLGI